MELVKQHGPSADDLVEAEKLRERLDALIHRLDTEAERRVKLRTSVEQRWIEDLRQFHGAYSDALMSRIRKNQASEAFINLTRPKTNAMIARRWDLLFPTDDRNWGVKPTPVPEIDRDIEAAKDKVESAQGAMAGAEQTLQQASDMGDEAGVNAAAQQVADAEGAMSEAQAYADELHAQKEAALNCALLMQEQIDDHLKECSFQAHARDAISDDCKLGIGVMKSPVLGNMRRRFVKGEDGQFVLKDMPSETPAAIRVDPWSFYPDPDACRPEDSDGFYERHLMNKQMLRRLAKRPDIDDDAVRELLRLGPQKSGLPQFMVDLRTLTGEHDHSAQDRFHVWEFTGPLDSEDMATLAEAMGDDATLEEMQDVDPLTEVQAKVWFCQGTLLSFALHPLDSGQPIYHWTNLEPAESGPYGYGIPALMRDDQSIMNGAQRMMMDNAGIASGPQVVVNRDVVEPDDGAWTLSPRKIWIRKNSDAAPNVPAFETYNIPMNQAELANIIAMSRQNIDETTSMPQIAQGEQGSGVTKTAQGMALLMNSANIVFKRSVKNWDDDMTVPIIRGLYQWLMQFSDNEAIKGDYEVDARGSSVLLVREMQAQNLLMIAQMFGDHPVYGPRLKHGDLLRQIFKAHMIPEAEVLRSETEYREYLQQQAESPPDPATQAQMESVALDKERLALEREKLEADIEMKNMERDTRLKIARMSYDATMHKVAETLNMTREQLDAKIAGEELRAGDKSEAARIASESSERRLAAEVAMKERTGDSSGGAV